MNKNMYKKIERYMLLCMQDSAHDKMHIYRVLYYALDIAKGYEIKKNILIAASLLHDIGREKQLKDHDCDHAAAGAVMAYDFLLESGWDIQEACHVKECIETHRYRNDKTPDSIEAKILYDADKLDATGTMGIARTLVYKGATARQLYCIDDEGNVIDGINDTTPSFFHEYNWKLKNVYDKLFTERARCIAEKNRKAGIDFYNSMFGEVEFVHKNGQKLLDDILK